MTTTYTLDNHPWRTDGKLRKRLDSEVHARNLAHTSVDLLGVVAAYAGQSYDGTQKTNLFPGRALVTPRSDPARHVKYRRFNWGVRDMAPFERHGDHNQQQHPDGTAAMMQDAEAGFYDEDGNFCYYDEYQQQMMVMEREQQQQQQGRQSPTRFEYDNMAELNDLQRGRGASAEQQQQSRGASAVEMFHAQQAELRGRKFVRNSPVARRALTPPASSFKNRGLGHQQAEEQQQQQPEAAEHTGNEREDQLMQEFGLRMANSRRDLERARECRYGLVPVTTPKKGRRGSSGGAVLIAATPVDYKLYPNRPSRTADAVRDKPLVVGERGFVHTRQAHGSFPAARQAEIKESMEQRKGTKAAVLHKAIAELKYQDRALLVPIPWYYSNHKCNQTAFLGGGNAREAQRDFLHTHVTYGNEAQLPESGEELPAEQQQQQQGELTH